MNWSRITHLGDAALVLPLLVAAIVGLAIQGPTQRRAAFQWALVIATSLLLVAASKIAFHGWGTGIRRWNLTCFSGHTVSAWLAWPALLMVMAPARLRALRIALLLTGIAIAACVGWSRVSLGAHPVSEVIAGTLLGAGAAGWIIRAMRHQALDRRGIAMLVALLLVLALLTQAGLRRPHTERWFQKIGTALSGAHRPVDRLRWRQTLQTEEEQCLP
ncbi:MAG: phosphatase PAP2 family protein [Luteimonas sp.]